MVDWRVYYSDGSTFSSEDGPIEAAPRFGVQGIVQRSGSVGRNHVVGQHFYWYAWERWFGGDQMGLNLHLFSRAGEPQHALAGEFVPDEMHHAVLQKLIDDPDFPPKSARNTEDVG